MLLHSGEGAHEDPGASGVPIPPELLLIPAR
jgi:hypothetical protein